MDSNLAWGLILYGEEEEDYLATSQVEALVFEVDEKWIPYSQSALP